MPSITPIGTDVAVNTVTANTQTTPVTAALADGRYIVVWVGSIINGPLNNTNYADADIRAQVYNEDGSRSGNEFVVNAAPVTGVQLAPAVTLLSDGNFLIAWQDGIGSLSNPASTPAATIQAREFSLDADGLAQPVGAGFQIGAGSEALLPAVTAVAGGGFVAAWQQGRSGNVVAQVFDSSNTAVGGQIAIDSTNLATIAAPRLATLLDGNFVIGWANNPATAPSPFSVQVYGTNGTAVSGEIPQYAGNPSAQLGNIIGLTSGGFAVSAQYNLGTTVSLVNFDLFFPDGTFGTTTQIAQNPVNAFANVRLAPLPTGGLVATWIDNNPTGSQPDIRIQAFNPIGDPVGTQYIVNTTTTGAQVQPVISSLSTGDFIVAWRDDSGGNGEIRARRIDFDPTNVAPDAVDANLRIPTGEPGLLIIGEETLTDFATDPDGDTLTVSAITNVTNGTAVLEAGGQIRITQTFGAPDAVSFDYTVSDGNGGTDTARARIVTPNDFVTLRGADAVVVDILANDYLQARANGYAFNESSEYLQLTVLNGRTQAIVNPFGGTTSYYNLLVGQTQQVGGAYEVRDPVTGQIDYFGQVLITLQGWAQIGGIGRDSLAGTSLSDHLAGGTGGANELVGGAGNDVYSISAAGDTIVELAGGGTDLIRLFAQAGGFDTFALPDNVENLSNEENANRLILVGNALDNRISVFSTSGAGTAISGGDGNDTIILGGGNGAELVGGRGNDVYRFSNPNFSVVEFANEGTDTVEINNNYTLGANVENLTYTGSARWSATGNDLDNIFTGGSAVASEIVGLGGNDTYVVRNIGDSIVEAAGGGIDTVQTALSVYRLGANVENLTYTGTGRFVGIGNALDNTITGGARGDDYLFAGAGVDTLTGGAGADAFFFDEAVNGVDVVTDFASGSDRLFFNRSVFTPTANFAVQSTDGVFISPATPDSVFYHNRITGMLSYDADGNGAGATVTVAMLSPGLTLTTADFVFYG